MNDEPGGLGADSGSSPVRTTKDVSQRTVVDALGAMRLGTGLAAIGFVAVAVGSSLTWVASPLANLSGLQGDGKITLAAAIAGALALCLGRHRLATIVGMICFGIGAYDLIHLQHLSHGITLFGRHVVYPGVGVMLVPGASAAVLAALAANIPSPVQRQGFWMLTGLGCAGIIVGLVIVSQPRSQEGPVPQSASPSSDVSPPSNDGSAASVSATDNGGTQVNGSGGPDGLTSTADSVLSSVPTSTGPSQAVSVQNGGSTAGGSGEPSRADTWPGCEGGIVASVGLSCSLTNDVFYEYYKATASNGGPPKEDVQAYSNTTGRYYQATCTVQQATVLCHIADAKGAGRVSFPVASIDEYNDTAASAYSAAHYTGPNG